MTLADNRSMEPPSKRIRAVTLTDRLSDLPDCLIHNILSLLESRQVVRTSLLSRRWRHIWRSVPCLDIDQTVFPGGDRCKDRKCCRKWPCKKEWKPFKEFGNNLLLLNNARSLDKLRIHVPVLNFEDRQAIDACSRWIRRGVQCSPAMIDIHLQVPYSLRTWFLPDVGSSSSRLTTLLLHGVKLDDSFAEQLRSGCPVLEELSLVSCSYHFGEIFSRSLRQLRIDDCLTRDGMVVTAPKLTSLYTSLSSICCPKGIYATDTSSFVKASVYVSIFSGMHAKFGENLCNIFNVMHLELVGANMMDGIQLISDKLKKFENVRTLLINGCNLKTNANIQALDRFLQSTPGLKKLTLLDCEFSGRSKRTAKWRHVPLESQNLMSFKCDNLEAIEIKHRKDDSVDELFNLLMGLWRNLAGKTNIKLIKV